MERRRLLASLISVIAAPSIVRSSSLMPISPLAPAWIMAHQDNIIFGSLEVRLRHGRNLDSFHGLIQPGQFFWRRGDKVVDICVFGKTQLDVTPGMISVRNLDNRPMPIKLGPDQEIDVGPISEYHLHGRGPRSSLGFQGKTCCSHADLMVSRTGFEPVFPA